MVFKISLMDQCHNITSIIEENNCKFLLEELCKIKKFLKPILNTMSGIRKKKSLWVGFIAQWLKTTSNIWLVEGIILQLYIVRLLKRSSMITQYNLCNYDENYKHDRKFQYLVKFIYQHWKRLDWLYSG